MILKAASGLVVLGSLVLASGTAVPTAKTATCPQDQKAKGPQYVGLRKCKTCHFKQYRSWKKTAMADAFNALKPGQRVEAKKKHSLDPEKDYTKDASCLPCHVVGYGKPGGYPELPTGEKPWTEKQSKLAAGREGVQCESCHGPGSQALPVFKDIKKNKRPYKSAELFAKGVILPDAKNCAECHNKKSPTFPKKGFDFKKALKNTKELHQHVKLKYRSE